MLPEIEGLFEIHITVSQENMHIFRMYCLDKKVKPINAIAEYEVPQLMFSKHKNGTTETVIQKAKDMEQKDGSAPLTPAMFVEGESSTAENKTYALKDKPPIL